MSNSGLINQLDFFEEEFKKYEQILEEYKKDKSKVFVDKNFHPTDDNIDNLDLFSPDEKVNNAQLTWKRIDEVFTAPLFEKTKIHHLYIKQGHLGDCYFITALSRIAKDSELVPILFETGLPDQILGKVPNSINIKCGAVVIYFKVFGLRTPVLIDTRIPFKKSQPIFSRPIDLDKSPWFCLVEKAYAKLNGSYKNIKGGNFSESFYFLFGYYNKIFNPFTYSAENILKILKYQKYGCLMDTSIKNATKIKDILDNFNLVKDHSYLIIKIRKYKETTFFFQLRNPWGRKEWIGDYSKDSDLLKNDPELKEFLKEEQENGRFWIADKDYFKYFNKIEVSKPINPFWITRTICFKPTPIDDIDKINPLEHPNYIFQLCNELDIGKKARFRIFVEKRNEEFSQINMDNSRIYILACKNGGQKMKSSDLSKKNCASSHHCISFSMKVLSKDDIVTFIVVHEAPPDVKSDFFVSVFCEYDFDLYDINEPGDKFSRSSETHGAVLDNFTKSDPYIAYTLQKVRVNGNEALWLKNPTISNFSDDIDKKKEILANITIKNLFDQSRKSIISGTQINCSKFIFNKELIGDDEKSKIYVILEEETLVKRAAFISYSPIDEILKSFTERLSIMMELKYPSIVNFIGFSETNFSQKPYPMIITDYYKHGTLYDALEVHLSELTNTKKMINLIGIAFAMNYIHKHNIILHFLRCSSIMLDDNFYPRIANFNSAKKCLGNSITHEDNDFLRSVPFYCWAPEFLSGSDPYSFSVDVFAYGMLYYHVICNEEPTIENKGIIDFFIKIYKGELPSLDEIPANHHSFIKSMWNKDPEKRPTFEQIIDKLLHSKYECWLDNVDENEVESYIHQFGETLKTKNQRENINIINQAKQMLPSNSLDTMNNIDETTISSNKNLIIDIAKILYQKDSSIEMSIDLFNIAADLNITEAFVFLGNAYKDGRGVIKNHAMAALYFKIAAGFDHIVSMFEYARILMNFANKTIIDIDEKKKLVNDARKIIENLDGKNRYFYNEARLCFDTIENDDASLYIAMKYFEKASAKGHKMSTDELNMIKNKNRIYYPLPYFEELYKEITNEMINE